MGKRTKSKNRLIHMSEIRSAGMDQSKVAEPISSMESDVEEDNCMTPPPLFLSKNASDNKLNCRSIKNRILEIELLDSNTPIKISQSPRKEPVSIKVRMVTSSKAIISKSISITDPLINLILLRQET